MALSVALRPAWADGATTSPATTSPADVLRSHAAPAAADFLGEVLARNPGVARARALAVAAELEAPQARSLDDPMAALTLFALPPETRVGPQRFSLTLSQKLPWLGKLSLREQAAVYGAAAARAEVEARRLALLTDARRALAELWFLDRHEAVTRAEREHLARHEEAARSRYSSGLGLQQEVISIQTEITRADDRVLAIEQRRRSLQAELNALRDRPADTPIEVAPPLLPTAVTLDLEALRRLARQQRPEAQQAAAEVALHEVHVELAEKGFRPDLTVGLGYAYVDRRQDAPGRANPPPDDGEDVLSLSAAVNLPVRRGRLDAALAEALARQRAAEEGRRATLAAVERELGDLAARLPLIHQQWKLLDSVLKAQAEEALVSAESAYATAKVGALDLLSAEHVLFEVRTAAERARTDFAVAWAELEGAVAAPLADFLELTP